MSAEQVLAILWRRRAPLVFVFLLVLGATAAVTALLPRVYSTSSYLWVTSSRQGGSDFEATQTNQVLSKTYAELLQTPGVAGEVAARLPFRMSRQEVEGAVAVAPVTQSQLIRVSADASSPRRAQVLADTYASVFLDRVGRLGADNPEGVTSRIFRAEGADLPSKPSRPRPFLYMLVGLFLALFAGVLSALAWHRLDQRLEVDSSTTELEGLPILARLPNVPGLTMRQLLEPPDDASRAARLLDACRLLLVNLIFVNNGQRPRSLVLVSPGEGEGKSMCCISVAAAAAERGVDVVVVDGDLRRPSVTSSLHRPPGPSGVGFSSLLTRQAPVALPDTLVRLPGSTVQLIPSGPVPPNPAALLAGEELEGFERRTRNRFELVVFDSPPVSVGADASLLAATAEGTVLVVDARRTGRNALVQTVDQLRRANANVLGIVLNRTPDTSRTGYYYRSQVPSSADEAAPDAPAGDAAGVPADLPSGAPTGW
ncbi:MAG: polysaccharide biosynthesis tyrosine autokinase [Acidimicrobiales bacterium]